MNNEVHLLHKANLLRLKEVAVSSNGQKPIKKVKQNEGTKEYVPNEEKKKIKYQEKTLKQK